jgi:hypothetical protein
MANKDSVAGVDSSQGMSDEERLRAIIENAKLPDDEAWEAYGALARLVTRATDGVPVGIALQDSTPNPDGKTHSVEILLQPGAAGVAPARETIEQCLARERREFDKAHPIAGVHACGHMRGSCSQCHQCLLDKGASACPVCGGPRWREGVPRASCTPMTLSDKDKPCLPAAGVAPSHEVLPSALLEAVDTLLETAPCDCSHKRRYEKGEHMSHCHLFDLNIARNKMLAAGVAPTQGGK